MAEAAKNLWRLLSPLLKHVAQSYVHQAWMEMPQPLSVTCSRCDHPHSREREKRKIKYLLAFRWSSLYFSLCPLPPFAGHNWEESVFIIVSHQLFIHTDETCPEPSPSWTILGISASHTSDLPVLLSPLWPLLTCFSPCFAHSRTPRTNTALCRCLTRAEWRGRSILNLLVMLSLKQPLMLLPTFLWGHTLCVCQDPDVALCKPAFQLIRPQHVVMHGANQTQVQNLEFTFVELHEVPASMFSSQSRSFWMAAHPPGASAAPPWFCYQPSCWRFSPTLQVGCENVKWCWSQYWPLEYSISEGPLAGLHAAVHSLLSQAVQRSLHLTISVFSLYFIRVSMRMLQETASKALQKSS